MFDHLFDHFVGSCLTILWDWRLKGKYCFKTSGTTIGQIQIFILLATNNKTNKILIAHARHLLVQSPVMETLEQIIKYVQS